MRIDVEWERAIDVEAARTHRRIWLHRLLVRVRFHQRAAGWSDYHLAILDTGAPYSLIPLSLWPRFKVERLTTMPVRGIVPGHAAELNATLAKVSAQLLDARHHSPRLPLWAMLAPTDQIPLILGWAGCLDRARLLIEARRRRAWIEF